MAETQPTPADDDKGVLPLIYGPRPMRRRHLWLVPNPPTTTPDDGRPR